MNNKILGRTDVLECRKASSCLTSAVRCATIDRPLMADFSEDILILDIRGSVHHTYIVYV